MSFLLFARWLGALCLLVGSFTDAAPTRAGSRTRDAQEGPMVFSHFMIGIMADRTSASDYDADMQRAKSVGIDAFALNIGIDDYTDTQLGYAYQSAANNGMKVFISFDFNWYNPSTDAGKVGQMMAKYASEPAQLQYEGKVVASSFAGDGLDVGSMRAAAGVPVFFMPNFHPGSTPDPSAIDGALSWEGWNSNGNNKAPDASGNVTVAENDAAYIKWLNGKPYCAPVTPWFFTHYGPEVSYSKNWVFPSDSLWHDRWNDILALKPAFVEIITWNDYGESHYVGPLSSSHGDDGNSKWANDMPHDGWLDMAKPFIAAYKAGLSSVDSEITEDQLVYWYRPNHKAVDCDATDTTMQTANNASGNYYMGRPNGFDTLKDSVFVVSLLTAPGTVTVTSGGNSQSFDAPAGASIFEVDLVVGQQQFALMRDSKFIFSGTSLKDVTDDCICGLYNYNAYVGTLPDTPYLPLQQAGLASLTAGLRVTTCSAAPSLTDGPAPTGAVPTDAPTTVTEGSGAQPTTSPSAAGPASGPPTPTGGVSGPPATTFVTSSPSKTAAPAGTAAPTRTSLPTSGDASLAAADDTTPSTRTCTAGQTLPGLSRNYDGLCSFACAQGYCPRDQCTCTATGPPARPRFMGRKLTRDAPPGCPLPGEDDSYAGLCSFSCALGYCPPEACTTECS